jgi:hypothetical protein
MSTRDKWAVMENILSQYEVTSLPELSHVALLDRVDTKYVMTLNQLYQALHQLKSQYRVLDIKGRRLNQYQTFILIQQILTCIASIIINGATVTRYTPVSMSRKLSTPFSHQSKRQQHMKSSIT